MFVAKNGFMTQSGLKPPLLWLDATDYVGGATWPARVGVGPTKIGTVTKTTLNGFPAALFSGGHFQLPSFTAPSHLSVFAVMMEASGSPLIIEQSTNANSLPGFYFYTDINFPYTVYRSPSRLLFNSSADWITASELVIASFNFNGSMVLKKNNTEITTTVTGTPANYATSSNATDTLFIGSRAGSQLLFNGGYLLELIIADGMLVTDYQNRLNSLRTKYSL